ncbi:protease m1 zinc metalloprotease, putative [Perkinsus marinus ATCC 50983]|uniref:Protease m1 zinc metalloprotease, putative n=1 Tax=Perkinsus marinus (strain ATCC 50983 / TXsc) TaxID=423536 RepID=C5LJ97_PERM5|nr:protease m1 zinc metalloprotease, putative [Perkinsus marinus ATCC 50983]EER03213.1 protease m1 zinc metalloprotease, putative [Perkinsus marinus ATCC 50983]|eukprot:XP_002771397.1 protease m1 zinc metalloprotease, putative [Perkinsus marinus ATCC 50983]
MARKLPSIASPAAPTCSSLCTDPMPSGTLLARAEKPGEGFAPISYDISLSNFDRDRGVFSGEVRIHLHTVDVQCDIISLHAVGMTISALKVDDRAAQYELSEGILAIQVPVKRQAHEVFVEYTGKLARCGPLKSRLDGSTITVAPRGLFTADSHAKGHVSSLDVSDLEALADNSDFPTSAKEFYIGTSLEPRHARRVYPCVDDPRFKASFTLRVAERDVGDNSITSISAARRLEGSVAFNTPGDLRLPTYSVGLFIGPFSEYVASDRVRIAYFCEEDGFSDTANHTLLDKRQRHSRDRLELTPAVSGHAAAFALEQMMLWFGEVTPYPSPPNLLRIVALPHHRGLGLETFGSISVKDTYCLLPKIANEIRTIEKEKKQYPDGQGTLLAAKLKHLSELLSRRRRTARLMCHEVSHMWFGDMLTPRSFQQLWLKEGMARLLEFIMCELLPTWTEDARISTKELHVHPLVTLVGILSGSHPIECPKASTSGTDDTEVVFDTIAYGKGACVLRMLRSAVGEEAFIKGLRSLLKSHGQSTYTEEDLWRAMGDASGWSAREIADWMNTWLREPGLPVVQSAVEELGNGYALKLWQLEEPCVISKRPPWITGMEKGSETEFDGRFSPRRIPLKLKIWWLKHKSVVYEDNLHCWLDSKHVPGNPLEIIIDRPDASDCELALLINPELESFVLCPPPSFETLPPVGCLSRVQQCALLASLALDIKRRREACVAGAHDVEKEWYWKALWTVAGASDGGKLSAAGAFYTAVEAECEVSLT